MPWQQLTPELDQRHRLISGDRPFTTYCPYCMLHSLELKPHATKASVSATCREGCIRKGFLRNARAAWPVVGCGSWLAGLDLPHRQRLRRALESKGRVAPRDWTVGIYRGQERLVLPRGVFCMACGGAGASIRISTQQCPYLTCAEGCTSRTFLGHDPALSMVVGWTVFQAGDGGAARWNDWFTRGSAIWAAWVEPSVAQGEAPLWTSDIPDIEETPQSTTRIKEKK